MQTENPLHMWGYWRDKKGLVVALEEYYPEVLASRKDLQEALAKIRSAEASIDLKMQELGD